MGVPAAFRWLSKKYPKIVSRVIEESPQEIDGVTVPVDTTLPNPNNVEYDNLYLDFNGIVHPCSHPEDRPPPKDEEEMMLEIYKYTERVINMVRPRKLLFIAIDGVAPRAKMNQQRSRRFRSAQESSIKAAATERIIEELRAQGREIDASLNPKRDWDSNAITPGTPFMDILAASLRYWIVYKLNTDPGWANLSVILSDAAVPGEGEHKIMEFIRSQRANPAHDPNTKHVMYGLDADLIMLGLATHEVHFTVLREDVFFQDSNNKGCRICGQEGHYAAECKGKPKEKSGEFDEKGKARPKKPFIWLHIDILREYLEAELFVPGLSFPFDLERAIDDWVFMCFFVGNDFLPHLPSLDIRENAIDTLISIWKSCMARMGGYVTCDGTVNLARAQIILEGLGEKEDAIFRRRHQQEERRKESEAQRNRQRENFENQVPENLSTSSPIQQQPPVTTPSKRRKSDIPQAPVPDLMAPSAIQHNVNILPGAQGAAGKVISQTNKDIVANRKALRMGGNPQTTAVVENKSAADALRAEMGFGGAASMAAPSTPTSTAPMSAKAALKRKAAVMEEETENTESDISTPATPIPKATNGAVEDVQDTVRLWEPGHKERYYEQKFHVDYNEDTEFRKNLVKHYVEGLCWVLLYYYQGCASWTWYFPYHFAPFASDFQDISTLEIKFEKGKPFKPAEQLMGVLPAASKTLLPEAFQSLMVDEESSIIDFYPEDFQIDMNGKKMAWQGVALLSFIDEHRLLAAMEPLWDDLSEEERIRNEMGNDVLFVAQENKLYDDLGASFYAMKEGVEMIHLNPTTSRKLIGAVSKDENCVPHGTYTFPLQSSAYPAIDSDKSISVKFFIQKSPYVHKSMLLSGAVLKTRTLNEMDVELMRRHASTHDRIHNLNWQNRNSPRNGNSQGYNPRTNGNSQGYNSNYGNAQGNNYGNSQGYDNSQGGGQHMKWFPPTPTPGVPPPNTQAAQWYQQTSSYSAAQNTGHNSGVLRLEDLQATFGGGGGSTRGGYGNDNRGGPSGYPAQGGYYNDRGYSGNNRGGGYGGNQDRGGYGNQDRGGYGNQDRGGRGYNQNQESNRYSGSGSGSSAYRDNRRR